MLSFGIKGWLYRFEYIQCPSIQWASSNPATLGGPCLKRGGTIEYGFGTKIGCRFQVHSLPQYTYSELPNPATLGPLSPCLKERWGLCMGGMGWIYIVCTVSVSYWARSWEEELSGVSCFWLVTKKTDMRDEVPKSFSPPFYLNVWS